MNGIQMRRADAVKCLKILDNGERCRSWSVDGSNFCTQHGGLRTRVKVPRYVFRTQELQAVYNKHLSDPDRYSIDEELAIIRTCMEGIVCRLKAENIEQLSGEQIALLTALAKDVADIAHRAHMLEKVQRVFISVAHIQAVVTQLADIAKRHMPVDAHDRMVEEFKRVALPVGGPDDEILPALEGDPLPEGKSVV